MAKDFQIDDGARALLPASTFDGWFNPSRPMPAVAPEGTPPRQFDYPLVFNQQWMPRAGEKVGFHHMRMMADGCYLIRVIIEKMKDRICAKDWHFRLKPQPGEYQAETRERSNKDPRIAQLTRFFEYPDTQHSWADWLRMLLEDRMVIDAACVEVQRSRMGGIVNLPPIDGATINVIIDATGRTPRAPLPAYRQIVKGLPEVDFVDGIPADPKHGQIVYMPGNVRTNKVYGYSPVEQTLAIILTLIYKTAFFQGWYDESNIPLAYMTMPENMSTGEMLRLVREIEAGNADALSRLKLLPVPSGGKIEVLKKEEYNAKFEEWCARIFAFIIGETATPFVQQNNRATANQSDDTREESGEQPLMRWVKSKIDRIIQRPDLFNAADIELVWDEEAATDPLKQAQVDQINCTIGTRTADELRQRDGLSPIWEDSNGNPPIPAPAVSMQTEEDEPGGNDDGSNPPKKKGDKTAKAAGAQKKNPSRY